ncbi:MAG: hypothetical protein HY880_02490 [Deltaproteobacteria bacterium]|nr:hypothetical protein [Deltaproteobacteria bacterium]
MTEGCSVIEKISPPLSSYDIAVNKHTREAKIYEGLDTRLFIYATYKDLSFREAYVEEYARRFKLDADSKNVLMEREKEALERYNEFLVSAYTPVDKWNDFSEKDSVWRFFLEDDLGRRLVPVEVKKAERADPLLKEFFPYLDYWSNVYIVRFPKYADDGYGPIPGDDTKSIRFNVAGALGRATLEWKTGVGIKASR